MTEQSADSTDRIPPLNLTSEELELLYIVVTTYNDGGAFGEGTGDLKDWENLREKVERIHRSIDTRIDQEDSDAE